MNVISLFDGKSCGRYCLEKAGKKVDWYFASEIDQYSIKVSKQNYPLIKQIGSVLDVNYYNGILSCKTQSYNLSAIGGIHLLIAGSPCQGFSFAGKGLNFNDPRSKLFFEFVRIYNELKIDYPEILFFLENVKMKKEYQDIISSILGVQPIEINAGKLSPTNRKRLYWTNIPNIEQPTDTGMIINDILEPEVDYKFLITEKALARGLRKTYSKPQFNPEKFGTLNTKNNSGQMSIDAGTTLIQVGLADNIQGHESKRRVYDRKGKCPTLLTHAGGHHHAKIAVDDELWRRLTPLECERIHGLPDGYTASVSDSQRYKMIGNGWETRTVTHQFKNIPH